MHVKERFVLVPTLLVGEGEIEKRHDGVQRMRMLERVWISCRLRLFACVRLEGMEVKLVFSD